jgi:hypothetical protein
MQVDEEIQTSRMKGAVGPGFSSTGKTGWLAPEGEDPEPASLILLSFVTAAK